MSPGASPSSTLRLCSVSAVCRSTCASVTAGAATCASNCRTSSSEITPSREALPREVERRAPRRERPLGDRALLVELEQLQVSRRDVAHQREQHRALGRVLRRGVRVRRLVPAPELAPEVELPRHVAGQPRRAVAEDLRAERDLVRALAPVDRDVREEQRARARSPPRDTRGSARTADCTVRFCATRGPHEALERRVVQDVEPRHARERVVTQHALGGRRMRDGRAVARRAPRRASRRTRGSSRRARRSRSRDVRRDGRRRVVRRPRGARREQRRARTSGAAEPGAARRHDRLRARHGGRRSPARSRRSAAPRMIWKKSGMKKIPIARREQHAGEHAGADRVAARRARAAREHQRQHAEDERERRHEDRAQPFARRLDRGLVDRHPCARSSLANSTMRIAFFAASPTTAIIPTWK